MIYGKYYAYMITNTYVLQAERTDMESPSAESNETSNVGEVYTVRKYKSITTSGGFHCK